MARDVFTAEFRVPPLEPLHGTLEQLFDLMETVAELGGGRTSPPPPVRPIEGIFLL